MNAVRIPVKQRSPEWLAARRTLITGTDIAAIAGVSPWRSEADVAADKLGDPEPIDSLRMRIGSALEPLIAREYEAETGRRIVRADGLYRHPQITWAGASLDFRCRSFDRIVETKYTGSRGRFADGLPLDVEAQVRWQLGVTGVNAADVAALIGGDELRVFTVEHDPKVWDDLVAMGADFRRRLELGGPFTHNVESVKRAYPTDDGSELDADGDVAETVERLIVLRNERIGFERAEATLEAAIKARMGEAAVLRGPSWRVIWRRTKDRVETDWKAVAAELGEVVGQAVRERVIARHTADKPGFRPFRVVFSEEAN